jgi:hypothetical protein
VLKLFESTLASMLVWFTESVKRLFVRARAVDTRFFRKLSELGEKMEETAYTGEKKMANQVD